MQQDQIKIHMALKGKRRMSFTFVFYIAKRVKFMYLLGTVFVEMATGVFSKSSLLSLVSSIYFSYAHSYQPVVIHKSCRVERWTDYMKPCYVAMMTSSHGSSFAVYWPFVRGIHRSQVNSPHKGQWHKRWCFLWSAHEQTVVQTIETPGIRDAIALIMT